MFSYIIIYICAFCVLVENHYFTGTQKKVSKILVRELRGLFFSDNAHVHTLKSQKGYNSI